MIFIYNSLFILLLGKLYGKKIKLDKYKKQFLFLTFFQMALFQGLRSIEVGTDTSFYMNVYDNYLHSEYYSYLFTHYEKGFQFLYDLLHKFSLDSQWLLIVVGLVTMFGFGLFIYNNSENVVLSTFIFSCIIYPNSFNIMRQCLGLSIAINSYYYIINNKYLKAFIIIIFSTLFHSTSILMFIPFVFQIVKRWNLIRTFTLIFGFVFFLFNNELMNIILPLLGKSYYLSGFEVHRYFRMTTMLTCVIAVLSWWHLRKNKTNYQYKNHLNLFSCIAFINMIFGLFYLRYEFFSRIIEYFNAFLIIAIPVYVIVGEKKYKKLFMLGYYLCAFLLMLNAVFNSASGVEVYKFFFL